MRDIKSGKYVFQDRRGFIQLTDEASLEMDMLLEDHNHQFELTSRPIRDVTHNFGSAHPTQKIDFRMLYPDNSQSGHIALQETIIKYDEEIKIAKELFAGVSSTENYKTYVGGIGISEVTIGIPSGLYDWLIKQVYKSIKSRHDYDQLRLNIDWKPRLHHKRIAIQAGKTLVRAKMYNNKVFGTDAEQKSIEDVTLEVAKKRKDAFGTVEVGLCLIRVRNPNFKSEWNLRFVLYSISDCTFTGKGKKD